MVVLFEDLYSDISERDLFENLIKKLELFFFVTDEEKNNLEQLHLNVLARLRTCIKGVENKYFKREEKLFFSYVHSGQYLIYLYYYSHECSKKGLVSLKDKLYYLNKILHSVDIYSDVSLPEVFFLEHPMSTVLGRAEYGSNFFAMQGCTIGGNKAKYPVIGNHLKMYSNSKILGACNIGNNVTLAANTYVKDTDIPDNSIVFGQSPDLIIKLKK